MYYNPEPTVKYIPEPSLLPLKQEQSDVNDFVLRNPHLKKQIERAHELSKKKVNKTVSVLTLTAVVRTISSLCHGFTSFAGQKKIAEVSGVSVRTVKNAVSILRKAGIIRTYHRYAPMPCGKKMRITSKTVFFSFIKHLEWARKKLIELGNSRNKISFLKHNFSRGTESPAVDLYDYTRSETIPDSVNSFYSGGVYE